MGPQQFVTTSIRCGSTISDSTQMTSLYIGHLHHSLNVLCTSTLFFFYFNNRSAINRNQSTANGDTNNVHSRRVQQFQSNGLIVHQRPSSVHIGVVRRLSTLFLPFLGRFFASFLGQITFLFARPTHTHTHTHIKRRFAVTVTSRLTLKFPPHCHLI
jgi:hypothetical protein